MQDLEQGLASAGAVVRVAGRRDRAIVSIDVTNPLAYMTLSYMQNAALHVFVKDAIVLFALVGVAGGCLFDV